MRFAGEQLREIAPASVAYNPESTIQQHPDEIRFKQMERQREAENNPSFGTDIIVLPQDKIPVEKLFPGAEQLPRPGELDQIRDQYIKSPRGGIA